MSRPSAILCREVLGWLVWLVFTKCRVQLLLVDCRLSIESIPFLPKRELIEGE